MRIAVLTGVFACAVIFAVSSERAGATTLQINEATDSNDTIVKMVAVSETNISSLLQLVDADLTETEPVKPEAEVVEPTKHIVEKGESLVKIAEKHNIQWKRIYNKNITIENPDIINVGEEFVIPKDDEVLEDRVIVVVEPVVTAPAPRETRAVKPQAKPQTTTSRGSSDGNRYVAGYCTWYVKNRRPDLPNNLGNASTWVSRATAQGMATGSTPQVGAVGQQGNHVVYIESVNGDGTVTVSDMNWSGLYVITTRTVPASNFSYIY